MNEQRREKTFVSASISGPVHGNRRLPKGLSERIYIDPKVAADQRGHGLGVSLEVYTISDLQQKRQAVRKLESAVIRKQKHKQSA
jgi:hypothetical protein